MPVSFETHGRVALEHGDEVCKLWCGQLRKKPPMTTEHALTIENLQLQLVRQVDLQRFLVSPGGARLRVSSRSFYVPDLVVIPRDAVRQALRERPRRLDTCDGPVALVVEVWSPSTGDCDVKAKVGEYQLRGNAEIWRLHPYERTLTAWRRNADGSRTELRWQEPTIRPLALPEVVIDIQALFELQARRPLAFGTLRRRRERPRVQRAAARRPAR